MKVSSRSDLTGPHVCCGTRILMQPSRNLLWSSNRPATHQQSVWRYRRGQLTSYRFHPMTSCCDIHNPHQLSWNQSRRKIDVAIEILIVLKVQDHLQPGWGVRFFSMFLSLLLPVCLMLLFLSSFLLSFEKCTDICISEQSHTSICKLPQCCLNNFWIPKKLQLFIQHRPGFDLWRIQVSKCEGCPCDCPSHQPFSNVCTSVLFPS